MLLFFFQLFQGTQSANPHNDYCQHFVDTGQRPHNFIRDVGGYMSLLYIQCMNLARLVV